MNRKLDIGRVFSGIFAMYSKHFGVLLLTALIVYGIPIVLLAVAVGVGGLVGALLGALLLFVASFLYQGMVVELVARDQQGEAHPSVGELFSLAAPRLGKIIVVSILAGLGIVLGLILLVIPGLILLTWWAVAVPVTVIEDRSAGAALGKSRELVKGSGWQVFAVIIIIGIINSILNNIGQGVGGDAFVAVLIIQLIISVLLAPIGGLGGAIMYFELKAIKGEGAPAGAGVAPGPGGTAVAPGPGPGTTAGPGSPLGSPETPGSTPPPPSAPPPTAPPPTAPPGGSPLSGG